MTHLGLLSILPPVLALALALWKKKIIPALIVGGLAAAFLLAHRNGRSSWITSSG